MIYLIIYLLAVYGISNIIVEESILKKPVNWLRSLNPFFEKLFSCTTCLSFWIGLILFLLLPISFSGIYIVDMLIHGFMASGFVNLIEHIKIKIM